MTKQKVLVIIGPTAVGKTALSLQLAKQLNGEIISGDSMQVYKQLTIGTAKITPSEMNGIPHHLIDFLDVQQPYSASDFKRMASEKIDELWCGGKLPMIVGGTGLYIEGLLYDMMFGGTNSVDSTIRNQLQQRIQQEGNHCLWEELYAKDPIAAQKIPVSNARRIVRALEVIAVTGDLFSNQEEKIEQHEQRYDVKIIGLTTERSLLYDRINDRVDTMLQLGLLQEAKWLLQQPNVAQLQSAKAIGYKELFPYLNGELSYEQAVDYLKQQSRRYAKRQLTWFRNRFKHVSWYDLNSQTIETIQQEVTQWLKESF